MVENRPAEHAREYGDPVAIDPILLASIALAPPAEVDVDEVDVPNAHEAPALLTPDEIWDYDRDPYPPCSMG